jgi:hypothetical protein
MAQVAVGDQPFATPGEPAESRPVTGHGPGGPAGRRHEDRAEGTVGQGGTGPPPWPGTSRAWGLPAATHEAPLTGHHHLVGLRPVGTDCQGRPFRVAQAPIGGHPTHVPDPGKAVLLAQLGQAHRQRQRLDHLVAQGVQVLGEPAQLGGQVDNRPLTLARVAWERPASKALLMSQAGVGRGPPCPHLHVAEERLYPFLVGAAAATHVGKADPPKKVMSSPVSG